MTTFGAALHEDTNGLKTSASYGDPGDGSSNWHNITRSVDGAHATIGAKADAAVTNPASSASLIALMKGLITQLQAGTTTLGKTEDAAHASGDVGIMAMGVRNDGRTALAGTTGDYSPIATEAGGAALASPVPNALQSWSLTRAATTAAAASLIIKASAGKLFKLWIVNNAGSAQFYQIFNSATLPADGVAPVHVIRIPTLDYREIDFSEYGDYFSTGIVVCNSSTMATKTIGAADSWFSALYL